MARRSLPKIDPTLDLSRHLLTFEDLPRPWEPAALFGRAVPLEVEMGSGKGLFLTSAASLHPERNYLGIEVAGKYARFAAARLARQGLPNARVVQADGLRVFREILPDASCQAVHVYFPDPWWKKRHKKRRVLNAEFLRDVERVLAPGGRLHFWTDVEEYFQTTLDLIRETTSLEGPMLVAEQPATHELDYRTHFERRVRLQGGPVFRSEFSKRPG